MEKKTLTVGELCCLREATRCGGHEVSHTTNYGVSQYEVGRSQEWKRGPLMGGFSCWICQLR